MSLAESAHKVIDLAREVRAYYDEEMPKWHPDYPIVYEHESEPSPPPAEVELRTYLTSLPEETVYALATLMEFERWFFRDGDLVASYETLRETFERPDQAAERMISYPPLGDSLEDALTELKARGIDVDRVFQETSPIS